MYIGFFKIANIIFNTHYVMLYSTQANLRSNYLRKDNIYFNVLLFNKHVSKYILYSLQMLYFIVYHILVVCVLR